MPPPIVGTGGKGRGTKRSPPRATSGAPSISLTEPCSPGAIGRPGPARAGPTAGPGAPAPRHGEAPVDREAEQAPPRPLDQAGREASEGGSQLLQPSAAHRRRCNRGLPTDAAPGEPLHQLGAYQLEPLTVHEVGL